MAVFIVADKMRKLFSSFLKFLTRIKNIVKHVTYCTFSCVVGYDINFSNKNDVIFFRFERKMKIFLCLKY